MGSSKQTVGLFILLAVVLSLVFWGCAAALGWWHWQQPVWQILLSGLLALLLASLVSALCWFFYRRRQRGGPSEADESQRLKRQYELRQLKIHFDLCWARQRRQGKTPYTTPLYFLINDDSAAEHLMLQQMGFERVINEGYTGEPGIPVNFWLSDYAIVVSLNAGYDPKGLVCCLSELLKKLKKKRRRQGANGLLVGQKVAGLLNQSRDELDETAKQQRLLIRVINQYLGLNLPVYCLVTQMGELKDFCQYFATYDDQRLEEPLGAMMPVTVTPGYDSSWFQSSFEALQKNLCAQAHSGLKAQLSLEYRESIIAGPYQFSLLRVELDDYFRRLFLDEQFEDQHLNFRGYFFTNASGEDAAVDRLTMLLASDLGLSSLPAPESAAVDRSLFVKQLLRRNIVAESRLVGVNRGWENFYGLLRVAYTGGLCLLFGLFLWLLKVNFDYSQGLDNRAHFLLDRHKEELRINQPSSDDLTATITSLSDLRDMSLIYNQPKPWYIMSWLPEPDISRAVEQAYQGELEAVFLVGLRDYLLKDLYVYDKLDDRVKTLELFNLQQILNNPDRESTSALVDYYVGSLQAEGEGDVAILDRFRTLLKDLLKPGVVPPASDGTLVELVKASLSSQDLSDLLYQHIMEHPPFSRRVDMRPRLGQNYDQVFTFSDGFGGYLVPYVFTREGFQELMSSTGFELASSAIKDYEGVLGRVSGKNELSRINRALKRRYIEDYVGYWRRILANVERVQTPDWGTAQRQLSAASEPTDSPLKRLYSLVGYHTDLAAAVADPDQESTAAAADGSPPAPVTAAEQQLRERQQNAGKVAKSIAQYFSKYHQLISVDDAGLSRLDLALRQLGQTLEWSKEAVLSKNRGRYFLDQLSEADHLGPLAPMKTLAENHSDKLLRELLEDSAEQLNELAIDDVRQLLNSHWDRDVMGHFNAKIKPFFPFDVTSELDVSLKAFKTFFGPKGLLADFDDNFVSHFNTRDQRYPVLRSFLPGQFLSLDESFWQALEETSRIQQALFTADKMGLRFSIRAQDLSAGLTEFSLRANAPLYVYRNGPSLWTPMVWPVPETDTRQIDLQLKGGDQVVIQQDYSGVWSWFRLAESMKGTLLEEGTTSVLSAERGEQSAQMLLRVEGDTNPFVVGFFGNLSLPLAI
ncbi:MAG: type VI secretion system membrane subunit TssM [Motiliproteus sp.]